MTADANDKAAPEGRANRAKTCPNCGKPRDPRYDPFCSKRCADVDLHRWLRGGYVIPGDSDGEKPGDEDE